ncbi:hypothetical protein M3596_21465 [Bacillus subtilis]|uniref:Uncharacterized protein n=1 Tax=Bacillus subtilis TaxID=1423 RepID=A0AAX3RHB0_BACIU|nr:hypothetical protein [Bacillus subtilis]MCM3191286.1 hypothetical protein [Bacillus subtilis]WEY82955.1 hypothetical protein P5633_00115 [Bacillus subtilis]
MNRQMISWIICGASVVANLILVIALIGQHDSAKTSSEKLSTLEKKYETVNKELEGYKNDATTAALESNDSIKDLVKTFFKTQFEYDNDTYTTRFDKSKKYVSDDVLNSLKGSGGELKPPKTEIKNTVKNLNVYMTSNDTETVKALVNMTTEYSIDGETQPESNQIYEVEVTPQNGDWIITNLSLMGSFQPYTHS